MHGQSRKRLTFVYDLCKTRKICDSGDDKSSSNDDGTIKVNKGCCRYQPQIRRKGLDLTAKWKEKNDAAQEKEMNVTAELVLEVFKRISDTECRILGLNYNYKRIFNEIIINYINYVK